MWKKGLTAARKGSAGWRKGRDDGSGAWGGVYKSNDTLMVNGEFHWHVLSHATFLLPERPVQLLLCVSVPSNTTTPAPPSVLFLRFCGCLNWMWFIVLAKSLKRRPAVLHCKARHFICYCVQISFSKNGLKRDIKVNSQEGKTLIRNSG